MSLERGVQCEFLPLTLAALQQKVEAVAESMQEPPPPDQSSLIRAVPSHLPDGS